MGLVSDNEYLEALKIIEDMSAEYEEDLLREISEMERIFEQAFSADDLSLLTKDLFRHAHDMKGQAPTFGYPLLGDVGNRLCRYVEKQTSMTEIVQKSIACYLKAIRTIAETGLKDDKSEEAVKLSEELSNAISSLESNGKNV